MKTRFAPSPTGHLHIGGVRTALFNFLLTKKDNGHFIIRIEDTDFKRNKEEFVKSIEEDLLWLKLIDEKIFSNEKKNYFYRQSERINIYKKYINFLIKKNEAYLCFCSKKCLEQEKKIYLEKNKNKSYKYSRKCLNLKKKEIKILVEKKNPYVVRLKISREKEYFFNDLIRKKIKFEGNDIEDFIILRQNGIPSYNFACVIDDHLMNITHVFRGEEHITNTAKQLVLYKIFDWKEPIFGHISIILNKEKKKISKRNDKNFYLIKELKKLGYLPSSILNYLLFLGWHSDDNEEFLSLDEMLKKFDYKNFHSRGAIFSLEKLNWYNNHYINKLKDEEFKLLAWKKISKFYKLNDNFKEKVENISLLWKKELNFFEELIEMTSFFFQKSKEEIILNSKEILLIKKIRKMLISLNDWEIENISFFLNELPEKLENSKKDIFSLLRKIITKKNKGPELAKIIFFFGKKNMMNEFYNYINHDK